MKNTNRITLGIESSCDETAVALVKGDLILSNVIASQHDIHSQFGGVVPELASRRHVEVITSLLDKAISEAGIELSDIDGVAVTKAPGLVGALLVGLSAGKAIAFSLKVPLIGVNHLEGHLNAAHLTGRKIDYPHIGLIVSGGHTSLYLVEDFGKYELLGATRDDAAGEAFDKVARLLHLGYPGGPIIDKISKNGDPKSFQFKTPEFRDQKKYDFSFSGIKTAVMHHYKTLEHNGEIKESDILNLVASFQGKVIDILTKNMVKAAKDFGCHMVIVSGGVAANKGLRERLSEIENKEGIIAVVPPMILCTDNAAMIAYVGGRYLSIGVTSGIDLNASAVEEIGL